MNSKAELLIIKSENNGRIGVPLLFDDHWLHIKKHLRFAYRPRMLLHILEHLRLMYLERKLGIPRFSIEDLMYTQNKNKRRRKK